MCGIHAVISLKGDTDISPEFKQLLSNRGPDHYSETRREVHVNGLDIRLVFTSTVLALRGDHIARQPLESPADASVLCWNGEAWKIDDQLVTGNDGETLLAKLASSPGTSPEERQNHTLEVLRGIQGPFAFVYFDAPGQRLYFGRDRLGRRSLVAKQSDEGRSITLSSVAELPTADWNEVVADGIYCLSMESQDNSEDILRVNSPISKFEWLPQGSGDMVSSIGSFNSALPDDEAKLEFDSPSVPTLKHWLVESMKLRVLNVPEPPNQSSSNVDTRIAILFSGGLDCTVLARLAHELLPASQGVDLINVAFQNPRQVAKFEKMPKPLQPPDVYEDCPDRQTGRKAFAELKAACPGRYWRFIAVNVPFEDAMAHKARVVSLIYPHDTEMDLSIAFALYFGARGIGDGYIHSHQWESSPPTVQTPARVLLSGLGADELFGGYSRHDIAFKRGGYSSLVDELKLDVSRIGQRNLGRDDRIMAHWGKEVRFPYLDEQFVRFAISCPVWQKCDFGNPFHAATIDPAKRVLRMVANQLGLSTIAREKKRAIQFGTRTAKIESTTGRRRGTEPITAASTAPSQA